MTKVKVRRSKKGVRLGTDRSDALHMSECLFVPYGEPTEPAISGLPWGAVNREAAIRNARAKRERGDD